jgi:DnaJ-class molecular chaperone
MGNRHTVMCTACNGDGRNPRDRSLKCPRCNGRGQDVYEEASRLDREDIERKARDGSIRRKEC